jgi:hypothetical protein
VGEAWGSHAASLALPHQRSAALDHGASDS